MAKRTLTIHEQDLLLKEEDVAKLVEAGMLYACREQHDLHLDPFRYWNLEDVEALALAIKAGAMS